MKRLLLIGPAPQNTGGISVHIRRLSRLMKDDFDIDYVDEGHVKYKGVFNIRSGNIIRYLWKALNADIIHIHSGIWSLRALNIIACKLLLRKKVVVTIHRDPNIEPHIKLTKFLVSKCDQAILVNQEGYDALLTKGKCKYTLLPAFLPPILEDEPKLPNELLQWIEQKKEDKDSVLLSSNASVFTLYNGQDLYGLDMCIDALNRLKKEDTAHKYYLVFVIVSNPTQQDRLNNYKKQIIEEGLNNNILIWEESVSFVRIIEKSDIVLRPTNTDGDAISIRESLYLGRPVLASDVVRRPHGVHLFNTRDLLDFSKKIKEISYANDEPSSQKSINYHSVFCSVYE